MPDPMSDSTPATAARIPYEGTDCTPEEAVEAVKAVRDLQRPRPSTGRSPRYRRSKGMSDAAAPYAAIAPGGEKRETYLLTVIQSAARDLRGGKAPSLVASNLEDSLTWDADPSKCAHPYWKLSANPTCRTCGADVSHIDPMGG